MSDRYKIDSHKLMYHPRVVSSLLDVNNEWEKAKEVYPIYVEVSPVGACNHRCTFCAVDYIGYQSRTLDYEVLSSAIKDMGQRGVKSIMFAGEGEPLLHKKIVEICEDAGAAGIDISFTSNATVIPSGFYERVLPITSWFKASVNAGTESTYAKIHQTKPADFNRVLSNLKSMVDHRNNNGLKCTIGAQILLLPENKKEIGILADICSNEIGLDYLVVKPYSQHLYSQTRKYEDLTYEEFLSLEDELQAYNSDSFQVVFRKDAMKRYSESEVGRYDKCHATPYLWAYIMSNGAIYSCSAFLLDPRFELGNLHDASFVDIWHGEARRKNMLLVENELDIKECRRNCRMDAVNRYMNELKNVDVPHKNFI